MHKTVAITWGSMNIKVEPKRRIIGFRFYIAFYVKYLVISYFVLFSRGEASFSLVTYMVRKVLSSANLSLPKT